MSEPSAYLPSWSMIVFGAGDGGGPGDVGGSALATPADAAQPPRISPAPTNLVTTSALQPIEHQLTGVHGLFRTAARQALLASVAAQSPFPPKRDGYPIQNTIVKPI